MKIPRTLALGLTVLCLFAATTASAHECSCNPRFPAPPAPPAAPLPPTAPGMPAPPAPPAEPPYPEVPATAHAACATKTPGAKVKLTTKSGTTMQGICERDTRGMYFDLRSIHSPD